MSVGVVILTLNAVSDLARLLPRVINEGADKIVVCDSDSADGTADWIKQQPGVELLSVSRGSFNHGATRELARKYLGTDIVVMLTQDVLPNQGWLTALVKPLREGRAVVSYARQLPHAGADVFEAFPREYNYPPVSQIRSLGDALKHGVYTFFCSDSCSAYINRELDAIGGFSTILTNEDYFAVARLLKNGGAIAYVAEAEVHHSHRYTLRQEFERYFDNGYVRAENPWVTKIVGQAEARGSTMVSIFLGRLLRTAPWHIPYAIVQVTAKWLGYRLGYMGYRWPKKWCLRFSSQKYYWHSAHCRHPRS